MKPSKHMLYFLVCTFTCGIWTGYYWRGYIHTSNNAPKRIQISNVIQEYKRPDKDCVPKKNIFFMKTHKTAGSTVQNVLMRYSDFHNLHMGLSKLSESRFHYQQGRTFDRRMVRDFKHQVNVICHHMRFNIKEVKAVMPNDTVFVTILREPSSLFESLFDYLHWDCKAFSRLPHSEKGFRKFFENVDEYYRGPLDGPFWWFAKNAMTYDLGYDSNKDDVDYIEESISELELTFDLVMISEHFDMSMVLLKDLLCWEFEDIAYLKVNARQGNLVKEMSEKLKSQTLAWNKADAALYEVFNSVFWNKVKQYGIEKMDRDVKILSKTNKEMEENCLEGGLVPRKEVLDRSNKVFEPRGVAMTGYNLKESAKSNRTCNNIIKPEARWFEYFLRKESSQMVQ